MPNMADMKVDQNVVLLAIGRSGSGKTTAIASFPKPMYIFDIDQRVKGMLGSNCIPTEDLAKIDYDTYLIDDGFAAVEAKINELMAKYDKRELEYKTIVFEGADQLCDMLLKDIARSKAGQAKSFLAKESGGLKLKGHSLPSDPSDYKYVYNDFGTLFTQGFKHFKKCNVICSAGTGYVFGHTTNDNKYSEPVVIGRKILVPNLLAEKMPRMFDEIWEFSAEKTGSSSNAQTEGRMNYMVDFRSDLAKTCFKNLPNELNITNKNLWQEIQKFLPKESTNAVEIKKPA